MSRTVRGPLAVTLVALLGCQATTTTSTPPPPPAPPVTTARPPAPVDTTTGTRAPARLTASAARRLLVTDVSADPHRPTLPARLDQGGVRYVGLYRICVKASGQIDSVTVNKGTGDAELDAAWMTTLRGWRYRPLELSGRKVPFCYVHSVEASARS